MAEKGELRLFLGIPIPTQMAESIESFQISQPTQEGIKWVPKANWHITVYFFGGVAEEMLENLQSLLELAISEQSAFELDFDAYSWGPSSSSKRMIWARFIKTESFKLLVQRIHQLYVQIDPHKQMRKSPLPHITLARLKNLQFHNEIDLSHQIIDKKLSVDQLVLWKSELLPKGAEYKLIRRFWLS